MHTIQVDTRKYNTKNQLVSFLKNQELKEGDKVKIKTFGDALVSQAVLVIALLALSYVFQKRREMNQYADKILDDLFDAPDVDALEKEIEKECGIEIEVFSENTDEADDEAFWYGLSSQSFQKAYGDDEPDYSGANILEPNPDYKK